MVTDNQILIPARCGELFEDIFLRSKVRRSAPLPKMHNVWHELAILQEIRDCHTLPAAVISLFDALYTVK